MRTALLHRRGRVVAALLCGVLLAGCSGSPAPAGPAASPSPSPSPSPMPGMPGMTGSGPGAAGALSATAGKAPADLALQLEALLGQHSVLTADMMRSRIRNDEDFAQVATAAVTRNTNDLTAVVTALFGQQAAGSFAVAWSGHVTAFVNYARGVATGDAATREDARGQLVQFENRLGDFFSTASQGRLPRDAAHKTLATHVDHLLHQADAYAARDYAGAADMYRTSYSHAFGIGHALATTLLPPDQAAVLDQPSWRLRSELDRLLGEHIALAVATLRTGATSSPDFTAAAAALNHNTDDLAGAVGTLFGPDAGRQFLALWADHIDALVTYTAGVAGRDETRRRDAAGRLGGFEGRLAAFLDSATAGTIPSADLARAFQDHDGMLTRQVDAAAGKDYEQAHDLAYDAYQDMFGLARRLADAFGDTVAARLPRGGAETGGGGTGTPGP